MEKPQATLDSEEAVFRGNIFGIARQYWRLGNGRVVEREIARRSPGVRILVRDKGNILVIREFRFEHNDWDCRLPGGKVFDTLGEYEKALAEKRDMLVLASEAAKRELAEETGLSAKSMDYLCKTKAGATVEWDLYYFTASSPEKSGIGASPADDEAIEAEWKSPEEVRQMCLDGSVREDRTVGVLLKYLAGQ